jgi:hypothetical protein
MYLRMKKPIIVLSPSRPIIININDRPTPMADCAMSSILHVSLSQCLSHQWLITQTRLSRQWLIKPVASTQVPVEARKGEHRPV